MSIKVRDVRFVHVSELPQARNFFEAGIDVTFGDANYTMISKRRILHQINGLALMGTSLEEMRAAVLLLDDYIYFDLEN